MKFKKEDGALQSSNSKKSMEILPMKTSKLQIPAITQLSTIEWMMILSFGIFKNDLRECLNVFLSNSYLYKLTHEFDWFWKLLIHLLLEEFQFGSKDQPKARSKGRHSKTSKTKNFSNFGSFIKEIQSCSLLYKRGTHYKQTKHLKKDENPKLIFLQVWRRVVTTGGSRYAPFFGPKNLTSYLKKLDDRHYDSLKSSKKANDSIQLFKQYEGNVKSLEITNEQLADNRIRLRAYELALHNAFSCCNFFTQSSCNSLLIELDMMFNMFSKTDISFQARMVPLKVLIEKRDTFTPIIEIACRVYKLGMLKQLKEAQHVIVQDLSDLFTMLQVNGLYKVDDEHNIAITIFNFIVMEPICPTRHPNTTLMEHLSAVLEFRMDISNMRCLIDCVGEISLQLAAQKKKISITVDENCKEKFGLISLISNLDEKKFLFDSIIEENILYKVSKLDLSKFFSLHSTKLESARKLIELYLKQQNSSDTALEQVNCIFDSRIDFENHSKLVNYLLEFEQFHSTMKTLPNNLMHTLCRQFYTFLKALDLAHSKTPFESNLPFDNLFDNFMNMFNFLHSKGFVQDCRDERLLTEILSARLYSFLTDNPSNTIPSAIIGRINFLGVKFSASLVLEIGKLIEMKHFTPLHLLYYSSLSLVTEQANSVWSSAFSQVYSILVNQAASNTNNNSISTSSDRNMSKIIEFSLLENNSDFTLSNFAQELIDLIVLLYFEPSSIISQ